MLVVLVYQQMVLLRGIFSASSRVSLCQVLYEISYPVKTADFGPFKASKNPKTQNFFRAHQAFPRPHNLLRFHARPPGYGSNPD